MTINFGEDCQDRMELFGTKETNELVSIDLRSLLQQTMGSKYCNFVATARSGTKLLHVEGDLSKFEGYIVITYIDGLDFT